MKPYARNPRRITKKRQDRLADTLDRLGDLGGIVHNLETDEVIGGNQRVAVFRDGLPSLTEQYDEPDAQGTVGHGFIVWRGHKFAYRQVRWDAETAAEANIAANLGAGEWDWDALSGWDAGDLQAWGFDEALLDNWNADATNLREMQTAEDAPTTGDTEPQIDRAEELREKWGVQPGQLWALGEHRVICGDCTDAAVVARVMDETPGICVTDPPYGVNYDPQWRSDAAAAGHLAYAVRRVGKVANDDRADWSAAWALFAGDVIYSWHPPGATSLVHARALQDSVFVLRMQIIWAKTNFAIGRGDYHVRHEPCWYAVRDGKPARRTKDRTQTTLWEINLDKNVDGGHSTQKPLECMARPIRNHEFDVVYDPFLGSGTTLIACENLGRRCRGVELSPGYVAVTLQRFADHTGKTPVLLADTGDGT